MISTRLEECLGLYDIQVENVKLAEEALRKEKEKLNNLLQEVIPDILAEIGSNEIKIGDHWIRMRQFVHGKINEEKYDEALNWIEKSGYGAIKSTCTIFMENSEEMNEFESKLDGRTYISERKIHHKTLEAAIKKMVMDDVRIPDDLIAVSIWNYAKID